MREMKSHRINFFEPTPKPIRCLDYDETIYRLAVLRADYSIEIWDMKETPYQEKIIQGDDKISVETLSWCNGRLFSGGLHGYVLEYDLNALQQKNQLLVTSGCPIWCMAANEKRTHLAVGNEDGHVNLLDVSSAEINFDRKFDNQEGAILCLSWHKNGLVIATGSLDAIRTWDVNTGHVINRIMLSRASKNTPTVVWCIAILRDMTIISGDSSGKLCFWEGNTGTLISSAGSKKGDILSIAVSENEDEIYASGVEPIIMNYLKSQSNGLWMKCVQRLVHTHDVRALLLVGNLLVSGGDDCNLVCTKYPPKTVLTFYPFCQKTYASVAVEASCILLQYPDYIELWKIGDEKNPINLLRIKPKEDESIICSNLSSNAKFIAYSTLAKLRLFALKLSSTGEEMVISENSLSKVDLPDDLPNAKVLLFNKESTKLFCLQNNKVIVIGCSLASTNIEATLNVSADSAGQIHLMALNCDDSFLACCSHDGNVIVYCLTNLTIHCRLPHYKCQPSALMFEPSSANLIVAYTDRKVVEYNIVKQSYTSWSKMSMLQELKGASLYPVTSMCICSGRLFLLDESAIYVIDKAQQLTPAKKRIKQADKAETMLTDSNFKTITKYEHISSIHTFNSDVILVQIPSSHILHSLPPPIWKKVYGT